MKKSNIFIAFLLGLFVVFTLLSWSKENSDLKSSHGDLMEQIEFLNYSYNLPENVDDYVVQSWFKNFCKIVAADVTGAAGGIVVGGKIGAWGGPKGAAIGAGVGAVVVGGMASYAVSSIEIDPNDQGKIKVISDFDIKALNSENPFDRIGMRHNSLLKESLLQGFNNRPTNLKGVLNEDELIFFNEEEGLINSVDHFFSNPKNLSLNKVLNWIENNIDSEKEKELVSVFLTEIYSISNIEDFQNYIYDFEMLIRNSQLTDSQRDYILMVTSVARHSGDFWHEVLSK